MSTNVGICPKAPSSLNALGAYPSRKPAKNANKIGNNNNLHGIRIVHLKGKMVIGDPIVFIIIYSEHRKEGFIAMEEAIYEYKNNSPVWKKEIYEDLTSQWITTKEELKKAFE